MYRKSCFVEVWKTAPVILKIHNICHCVRLFSELISDEENDEKSDGENVDQIEKGNEDMSEEGESHFLFMSW